MQFFLALRQPTEREIDDSTTAPDDQSITNILGCPCRHLHRHLQWFSYRIVPGHDLIGTARSSFNCLSCDFSFPSGPAKDKKKNVTISIPYSDGSRANEASAPVHVPNAEPDQPSVTVTNAEPSNDQPSVTNDSGIPVTDSGSKDLPVPNDSVNKPVPNEPGNRPFSPVLITDSERKELPVPNDSINKPVPNSPVPNNPKPPVTLSSAFSPLLSSSALGPLPSSSVFRSQTIRTLPLSV